MKLLPTALWSKQLERRLKARRRGTGLTTASGAKQRKLQELNSAQPNWVFYFCVFTRLIMLNIGPTSIVLPCSISENMFKMSHELCWVHVFHSKLSKATHSPRSSWESFLALKDMTHPKPSPKRFQSLINGWVVTSASWTKEKIATFCCSFLAWQVKWWANSGDLLWIWLHRC